MCIYNNRFFVFKKQKQTLLSLLLQGKRYYLTINIVKLFKRRVQKGTLKALRVGFPLLVEFNHDLHRFFLNAFTSRYR